jgi:hypothetical protein
VILVDSNILMYAAGSPHPFKAPSHDWLERAARGEFEVGVDAEVLQEILHRYRNADRWEDGRRVYDLARRAIPGVLPITVEALDEARDILDSTPRIPARDALHAAVCRLNGAEAICSYDRHYDAIRGIRRIEPGS